MSINNTNTKVIQMLYLQILLKRLMQALLNAQNSLLWAEQGLLVKDAHTESQKCVSLT